MNALQNLLRRWLKLPGDPTPPAGSPGSLRVLHASDSFVRYRQLGWLIGHAGFFFFVLAAPAFALVVAAFGAGEGEGTPGWLAAVLLALLGAVVLLWGAMAALSFIGIELDRQFRTYMLTDRTLRIREGIWIVREITLSYANVQNVSVSQGPVERLFGISSVRVETAGGGGGAAAQGGHAAFSGHAAVLRGLDDAETLRDELVAVVRRARGEALAAQVAPARAAPTPAAAAALPIEALRAAAAEARRLREALTAGLLVLVAALLAVAPTPAVAAPHRALFVGNSYTYFNAPGSFPERYRALQQAVGYSPVAIDSATKGGWTFAKHLADAQTDGEALQKALLESWDVVTFQGQSQIPGFFGVANSPYPAEEEAFVALTQLAAKQTLRIVLLRTWGRRDGDIRNPGLFATYTAMQDRLDAGTDALAAAATAAGVQVTVVPVGGAFRQLHAAGAENGSLFWALYNADGSHPSPLGSHLMALCAVAKLEGVDPRTLPAPADLDATQVSALADAANAMCRDAAQPSADAGSGAPIPADTAETDTAETDAAETDAAGTDAAGTDSLGSEASGAGSDDVAADKTKAVDGCSAPPRRAAGSRAPSAWAVVGLLALAFAVARGRRSLN